MKTFIILMLLFVVGGCSQPDKSQDKVQGKPTLNLSSSVQVPMRYTETFVVRELDGYQIIDLKAPMVSWGGSAQGNEQSARIILVPRDKAEPVLTGDLEGATVVRTPVMRIATNYGFLEAIVSELGIKDRLVAVGGVKSYDDELRAQARSGELAQIGYGWHTPPNIAPLLDASPDVLLMVMGSLEHVQHMQRISKLGIPVVPIFFEAETHYMGPVDYVRLIGLMTGKEKQAQSFVNNVAEQVEQLKAIADTVPRKKVLSSWYGGSDRWMVTVRNADNALLRDAGGMNPLAQPDDIRIDDFVKLSSEVLLEQARDVDCWVIRDSHSQPFTDVKFLHNFKAWRQGCLFAADGSSKPEADAFDIYATGQIRPDLILRDLVQMLHPNLINAPFTYIQPDSQTPRP